jgi:ABC-type glycerol-3-phosphate transport system substrate-binding protein
MTRLVAVLALAAALVVAGCGDTVIDGAKTEDTLQQSLEQSQDKKISTVECPSDQKVEPDTTFTCTVTLRGGEEETATLEIRNEDADISVIDLSPNE